MAVNQLGTFQQLEILNAQVDISIDEEDFGSARDLIHLASIKVPHRKNLLPKVLEESFKNPHCAVKGARFWHNLLDAAYLARESASGAPLFVPVEQVSTVPLTPSTDLDKNECQAWSILFFAKYLRARVQEKGTDCYFKRMDDIVRMLEVFLPRLPAGNGSPEAPPAHMLVLHLLFLLEMAATAEPVEGRAYADRARRLVKQSDSSGLETYDLQAQYNKGVSLFHDGQYSQAMSEFDFVIHALSDQEQRKREPIEGEDHLNSVRDRLLLLPSWLKRAQVQLKLQLAYDTFLTVDEFIRANYNQTTPETCAILAEAYLQLECPEKCWERLRLGMVHESCLATGQAKTWEELDVKELLRSVASTSSGRAGRLVELYVELLLDRLASNDDSATATATTALMTVFESNDYYDNLRYNAINRQGYYEQLARFLGTLAKPCLECTAWAGPSTDQTPVCNGSPDQLEAVIRELYDSRLRGLGAEESDAKRRLGQRDECDNLQVRLGRLAENHYRWFKDGMLDFLDAVDKAQNHGCLSPEPQTTTKLGAFREQLIKWLIRTERRERGDIRVSDLQLRYRSQAVQGGLLLPGELGSGTSSGRCWPPSGEQSIAPEGESTQTAFKGWLACRSDLNGPASLSKAELYEDVTRRWFTQFKERLTHHSIHPNHINGLYLLGLQRWNSSSPALGVSLGGGYLLYETGDRGDVQWGVAIDPGFDFVRNLFHMGFCLGDIDVVLLSHEHLDHVRDFESLVALRLEEAKRAHEKRRVLHTVLSRGTYQRLSRIFNHAFLREYVQPYMIDDLKEIDRSYFENLGGTASLGSDASLDDFKFAWRYQADEQSGCNGESSTQQGSRGRLAPCLGPSGHCDAAPRVAVDPTRAYHDDHAAVSDSFGFRIGVKHGGRTVLIGYTGDTKWTYREVLDPSADNEHPEESRPITSVATQYVDCDVILAHLGSLIDEKRSHADYSDCLPPTSTGECERLVQQSNHPYLIGMIRFASEIAGASATSSHLGRGDQLILLSEFGEELRGEIRRDLASCLTQAFSGSSPSVRFLPLDVGVEVCLSPPNQVGSPTVYCVQCGRFVPPSQAAFERAGTDEALFCVCQTCQQSTPHDVLSDKLRTLYEIGYPLQTVPQES